MTCHFFANPVPLGWGDHVRWMHESDKMRTAAGPRHALARREAAAMRSRAYAKSSPAWRLERGAHPVERYAGIPAPHPVIDRHYGEVEGMVKIAGYLTPRRRRG